MSRSAPARAVIFGCQGLSLTSWEKDFFRESDPFGFILFARNVESPRQILGLTGALRETVGRPDAPILIDQEGGRVQRLRPPFWRAAPEAARFGTRAAEDLEGALRATWLNSRLIAQELSELGISVDCLPCLDLRHPEGHGIIGDRAYGEEPGLVAALGRAACQGLRAGGVLPVVKHLPGHGRATVDSHLALPRVATARAELEETDFAAFRGLRDAPWGMTAHVIYEAIDPARPATVSPSVIAEVIRGFIGFDGLLLSDDLSMQALSGDLDERARACLAAGCDLALHCNGDPGEMAAVAKGCGPLSPAAEARWDRSHAWLSRDSGIDVAATLTELEGLLA